MVIHKGGDAAVFKLGQAQQPVGVVHALNSKRHVGAMTGDPVGIALCDPTPMLAP